MGHLLLLHSFFQGKALGDRLVRTGANTIPAADALRVVGSAEYVHVHFTDMAASTAGSTFILVNLKPVERNLVEQGVKSAQWANPFAERTIKEHGKHHNAE